MDVAEDVAEDVVEEVEQAAPGEEVRVNRFREIASKVFRSVANLTNNSELVSAIIIAIVLYRFSHAAFYLDANS